MCCYTLQPIHNSLKLELSLTDLYLLFYCRKFGEGVTFLVNSIATKMDAELESEHSFSEVIIFSSLGFSTTRTSNTINSIF